MEPHRILFHLPASSEACTGVECETKSVPQCSSDEESSNQLPKGVFLSRAILQGQTVSYMSQDDVIVYPNYAWQSKLQGCFPDFTKGEFSLDDEFKLESAQKWITYPGKVDVKFPLQTIQPKVQMIRKVPRKQLPRDVEVDRRRRKYAKFNMEEMIKNANIEKWKLLPIEIYSNLCHKYPEFQVSNFEKTCFLSLEMFDNQDLDCYSPSGWLRLGLVEGTQHPLPALAFLPKSYEWKNGEQTIAMMHDDFKELRNNIFCWKMVAVYGYDSNNDKWTVVDLEFDMEHHLPRIYFMFIAENPFDFLKRLKHALSEREISENSIKYEFILDCLLMTNIPEIDIKNINLIERKAKTNLAKLMVSEEYENDLKKEIQLSYQREMASFEFEDYIRTHPDEFPHIQPIRKVKENPRQKIIYRMVSDLSNIDDSKYLLKRTTLYYVNSAYEAMCKVAIECANIEVMHLYHISFTKVVTLSDFLSTQQYNCSNIVKYLKGFWVENISAQICICLRGVGKGWLDLSMSDWGVFLVSKLFRFLLQVKFRMQDSLHYFLQKSILNFSHLLNDPCQDFLALNDDYIWDGDFKKSPFHTGTPLFYLILNLSQSDAFYSTDPKEFAPAIGKIFHDSLMQTCGIRIIDADVMQNLNFARNLFLLTVEMIEDVYIVHRDLLKMSYTKAITPLRAYALKYHRFLDLFRTSVNDYINNFAEANKPSQEVKEEILHQKLLKEELRQILPAHIAIGPFYVNVDPLKQHLISKRIEIIKRLFEYYVDRMYNTTEDLLEQFQTINGRLTEKAISIEHLYEIKEYILTIPDLLEGLKERVQVMMLEYDVLDFFWYNLTDMQFAMKWEAFAWPHKIVQRLFTINEEHKNEIEEFKRMQMSEVVGFEEKLESLNEEIMTYSLQFNASKALEIAVEAKKTWKTIQEMEKLGELLKTRQIIFELEELSLEFLQSIITSFTPYKNLWTACSDFLKLEEATTGNPLVNIELEAVKLHLAEIRKSLEKSVEIFNEKVEIQNVAKFYIDKIKEFIPVIDIIECLKNPHWLIMHWQELGQKSGIEIKYSAAINFMYCMKKGIMEKIDLVKDIAKRAVEEADAIQKAFEEEERLRLEEELARLERKKKRKCRTDIL